MSKSRTHEEEALAVIKVRYAGNITVAVASILDGEGQAQSFYGVAKRGPEDRYSQNVGLCLASARALSALAAHFERTAWGEIKHQDDMREHKKNVKKVPVPKRKK